MPITSTLPCRSVGVEIATTFLISEGIFSPFSPAYLSIDRHQSDSLHESSNTRLKNAVLSNQFRNVSLIPLTIGALMILELCFDYYDVLTLKHHASNLFNFLSRFFLLFGLISPSLLMMTSQNTLNFLCSESLKRITIVGFITVLICENYIPIIKGGPAVKKIGVQAFSALFLYICAELFWLSYFILVDKEQSFLIISVVNVIFAYLLLTSLSFRFHGISTFWMIMKNAVSPSSYLSHLFTNKNKKISPFATFNRSHLSPSNNNLDLTVVDGVSSFNKVVTHSYLNICLTTLFFGPIIMIIMALALGNKDLKVSDISINELCGYIYLQAIFMAFLIISPHRQLRR